MTFSALTGCRHLALPAMMVLGLWTPALAQDDPAPLTAAEFAPAETRNDAIPGAYEVVHWAERGQVFVASVPSFEKDSAGAIHVLAADDLHPIRQIALERRPFALALDRRSGRLYAGNSLDGSLTVIDLKTDEVLTTLQLGEKKEDGNFEHVRMIALDAERGLAFVTSPGRAGVVWIVDTRADKVLHRIEGGVWPAGAAYDAKSGRLYTSGGGIDEIQGIDVATGTHVSTLSTGDTVVAEPKASRHFFVNLAIDPEGQRLFAADANTGALYVFDITRGRKAAQVAVGPGMLDVAYNPARQEIYATWRGVSRDDKAGRGGLVVIDAQSYAVTRRIDLPPHPNSLEVSEDGQTLFVTVKAPHDKEHPDYRDGAMDSTVRIDLSKLPAAPK